MALNKSTSGGGDSTWKLFQNFGTSSWVDDGTHGTVDTTTYSNGTNRNLTYDHSLVGTPDTSYLGWRRLSVPYPGNPHPGPYESTLSDHYLFYGGAQESLGYEFDVSNFSRIKFKYGNVAGYTGVNHIKLIDTSSNITTIKISGATAEEHEYDTTNLSKIQIIEGPDPSTDMNITGIFWILVKT